MTKEDNLKNIAEQLTAINNSLIDLNAELSDISFSSKMLIFFKLMELRPEKKDKLGALIDEMADAMDFDIGPEDEDLH